MTQINIFDEITVDSFCGCGGCMKIGLIEIDLTPEKVGDAECQKI